MSAILPLFGGTIEADDVPTDLMARLARRVEDGLLAPGSRCRANYVVRECPDEFITFGVTGDTSRLFGNRGHFPFIWRPGVVMLLSFACRELHE